jgi:hypothetical protein
LAVAAVEDEEQPGLVQVPLDLQILAAVAVVMVTQVHKVKMVVAVLLF